MASPFVFPPPPPPPPRPASSQQFPGPTYPNQQSQWAQHGRGNYGNDSGRVSRGRRGYGGHRGDRSAQRSGYSYQQRNGFRDHTGLSNGQYGQNYNGNSQQNMYSQYSRAPGILPRGMDNFSQSDSINSFTKSNDSRDPKRPYEQAFTQKSSSVKTQTAPSVPSFGTILPSPSITNNSTSIQTVPLLPPKKNLLGLIPYDDEDEVSDEDEETKLAATVTTGAANSVLSFSYRGKLATLKTSEDIASWIAERRKNFPTTAKREAMAKKQAEERDKTSHARQEAQKKAQETKQSKIAKAKPSPQRKTKAEVFKSSKNKPDGPATGPKSVLSKEQTQIEKLRKSMKKNAKKLAKLEAATRNSKKHNTLVTITKTGDFNLPEKELDCAESILHDDDSSMIYSLSESESTSSSGSSLDDSDQSSDNESHNSKGIKVKESVNKKLDSPSDSDTPQELTSTHKTPPRIAAPTRNKADRWSLCRNLKKYGKCTRKACKYQHTTKDKEKSRQVYSRDIKPPQRLSLYQRLLKQQIEEDERAENEAKKG